MQEDVSTCPVSSWNEWDPLEEVLVGRLDGATFPDWRGINEHTVPVGDWERIERAAGGPGRLYPAPLVEAAQRCLEGFIHVLESEGVTVRRPDVVAYDRPFATPDWQVDVGFSCANPRDPFMVVGHEIIETPMADRNRYFEGRAYRRLFREYLRQGARWSAAPRPQLLDSLYDSTYVRPTEEEPMRFVLTEEEPVFDAADAVRCGRDIFIQLSHVTNRMGALWLQRHLGDGFRVHHLESKNPEAIHIDTTFVPLAPGKVLVSPEYVDLQRIPAALKSWEVLVAPEPVPTIHDPLGIMSKWGAINVLMLDPERPVVEARQEPLIRALREWGFKPIPVPFEAYYPFMGGFHCSTLDIRRRGSLQSYCDPVPS
jgi:glycine amidinotransferase